ncbi:hypothetical protein SMICM304S_10487 [Streptomyces microflavus]
MALDPIVRPAQSGYARAVPNADSQPTRSPARFRRTAPSPLRAQRLAVGLTLTEAADQIRELVSDLDRAPRVTVEQLRLWETGGHQPLRSTVLMLAAFYGCSPGGWAWKTPRPSLASSSEQSPGMGTAPRSPCPPSASGSRRLPSTSRTGLTPRGVRWTVPWPHDVDSNQLDHIDEIVPGPARSTSPPAGPDAHPPSGPPCRGRGAGRMPTASRRPSSALGADCDALHADCRARS